MVEIRPIKPHQTGEAKRVMLSVCLEMWPDLFREEQDVFALDPLEDIADPFGYYFEQGGTFLVTMIDGKIIGIGALRSLKDGVCELRRMWLLPQYQGRGLGRGMAEELLSFARGAGYRKVRLETYDEARQVPAIRLYESLGFDYIPRYNDGLCTVFMEKRLD